ncbi:hypothetical protein [Streptomyces sp. RKAG293]|uniref:hypothetical protein n=1 Tax=Streptomyces sp. RKAG293 TaxID=2893403 RepID=UPI0020344F7E|nr:hypothetical protein [Streptomyces sp. RKAG293]MCM2417771.1 hypothetical protein [Streptomyces sp. RKAG293]
MAESEQQSEQHEGMDRRGLAAAFVNEVRQPGTRPRMLPRAWAVGIVVAVVGAGAVGVGMMAASGGHSDAKDSVNAAVKRPATGPGSPSAVQKYPTQPSNGGSGGPGGTGGNGPGGPGIPGTVDGPGGPVPAGGADAVVPGAPSSTKGPVPGGTAGAPPVNRNSLLAKKAAYTAVAGYGCAKTETYGFAEHGRNSNGVKGWLAVKSGGWKADGCNGQFDAMPMSGNAGKDDPDNYATWYFRPVAAVTKGACQVQIYVPNDKDITHVGGNPAHFEVFNSFSLSDKPIHAFDMSQSGRLGTWVQVGSFPITKGLLMIKLDSRGQDWHGSTVTYAHLAVTQMRATCN